MPACGFEQLVGGLDVALGQAGLGQGPGRRGLRGRGQRSFVVERGGQALMVDAAHEGAPRSLVEVDAVGPHIEEHPVLDIGGAGRGPEAVCPVDDITLVTGCCQSSLDCDDGLACTTESCNPIGQCANTLDSGRCLIGGGLLRRRRAQPGE